MQTASVVCVRHLHLHTCLQQPLYLLHKGSVEWGEVFACERHDDTFILAHLCVSMSTVTCTGYNECVYVYMYSMCLFVSVFMCP